MAQAGNIILAVGAMTVTNDVLFNKQPMNWKVPIATAIGALMFTGFQSAAGEPAVLLAWLALVGSLLYTPKTGKPLAVNLSNWATGK